MFNASLMAAPNVLDTALRDLQELVHRGHVQATGTTRDCRYVLVGDAGTPAIHRTAL
jgi:hypothetical protein